MPPLFGVVGRENSGKTALIEKLIATQTVVISSAKRVAVLTKVAGKPEPTLAERVRHLDGADIILVEGFKDEPHPKLEVQARSIA
jgi:molybdopterin-guanine dinucleotide biosynthesis adapter protein